jgi:NDP-sugar pyrophosphorylase family protein
MRAVILAGGKGSRLRPFTITIPKPLVPIGDLPILEILIRQLKSRGFDRITISVGHLASLIRAFCGNGEPWHVPIDYLYEDQPLGTIGCLGLLEDLTDDRVLVVNGDTLTDLNMAEVYAAHDGKDAITVCANRRSVEIDFGVLETGSDGYLSAYTEKPVLSYKVSMGVNVLSAWAIARYIPRGERLDTPDLVHRLLAQGEGVRVLSPEAYWLDLGRMKDLETGVAAFQADPRRFLPDEPA